MECKIGDKVWVAIHEKRKVTKECPICFGKKMVTLILGNNDSVILPCAYCGRVGYDPPKGIITEYEFVTKAETRIIDKIEKTVDEKGEHVEYRSGHYVLYPDKIYATKEEAEIKSKELCEEAKKEQETRAEYLKKDIKKSFSWNAGYHLRESKKHFSDAKYHMEKAVLCKERIKKENTGAQDNKESGATSLNSPIMPLETAQ